MSCSQHWLKNLERKGEKDMKYRPADSVRIETTYNVLRNSIISALERDTGQMDIVDEILRILSIRIKKRNNASTWANNFRGTSIPPKQQIRITNRIYRGNGDVF